MCTIAIEPLTPLNRTSCIKVYKDIARSKLFCRIAKRSILRNNSHFSVANSDVGSGDTGVLPAQAPMTLPCPTLKDKSEVDKIIAKKQPYQQLNTNREFFPSFDASNFHKLDDESS